MADPDGELTVAQRLGRALDRGLLPAGGPAEAAERLIERLERPARVALLGLPGSGKSAILNLLVGAIVVPETLRLPTIIVQHGDASRMACTLTDGTTRVIPGHDLAEVLPLAPALVTLEMDLPALRVISMLEVSAGPMEAEQKRAATWASKRADIVIWCTTSYLPKEQAVWESLPDGVKDNSFMFLTKVDLLGSRDAAGAMHDRVELRAGEEFRQILSISAKQARAAMPAGGPVNRDLFRDSGASAVIAAIKTRVQSGRRADMDTAELLLARHVEATELVARRFAEAEEDEASKAWTPPPEPVVLEAVAAPGSDREPEPVAVPDELPSSDTDGTAAGMEDPEVLAEPGPEPDIVADTTAGDEGAAAPTPELEAAPEPVPEVATVSDPAPVVEIPPEVASEPEQGSLTRRRFADRIKRVAADGEAASPPMVPLKSTWKSKSDTEAAPEPEPQPVARPAEATRRPRTAAAAPMPEAEPTAEIAPEPDPDPAPGAEPAAIAAEDEVDPVAPAAPEPRDRRPRAVTPRPEPAAEASKPARPLFGARRGVGDAGSPLPDLSSLRATPEEIAASAASADAAVDPSLAEMDDDWQVPEVETETEAEVEPTPAPAPHPAPAVDRPRLFESTPRPTPSGLAAAPTTVPMPRATPISRMPAPPRAPAATAPPEPVAARAPLDEAQFSPRAIMMRERRSEPEAPAPRRERPRIAARAIAAPMVQPTPSLVAGTEHPLIDEAVALLVARSADLEQQIDPDAKLPVDLILDHARDTADQVMAVLTRGQSDPLRRVASDLGEVMDLIMLMQLEKGHAPADDALTMLLQLKRELETLRAA